MSSYATSISTNQTIDESYSNSQAATIGDLSSDNQIVYGEFSYVEQGLVGENLDAVLDSLNNATDKTISSVQSTAAKAIEATGQAYAESKSELRNLVDAVRPIALYAAIAAAFYFIFAKGK